MTGIPSHLVPSAARHLPVWVGEPLNRPQAALAEGVDLTRCSCDSGRVLFVYDRPGSPPGNTWVACPHCEQGRAYQKACHDHAVRIGKEFSGLYQNAMAALAQTEVRTDRALPDRYWVERGLPIPGQSVEDDRAIGGLLKHAPRLAREALDRAAHLAKNYRMSPQDMGDASDNHRGPLVQADLTDRDPGDEG